MITSTILLVLAIIAYILFYLNYVPQIGIERVIHLQYGYEAHIPRQRTATNVMILQRWTTSIRYCSSRLLPRFSTSVRYHRLLERPTIPTKYCTRKLHALHVPPAPNVQAIITCNLLVDPQAHKHCHSGRNSILLTAASHSDLHIPPRLPLRALLVPPIIHPRPAPGIRGLAHPNGRIPIFPQRLEERPRVRDARATSRTRSTSL